MNSVLVENILVNLANNETLQQLPGVGPRMAERIIAARPFNNLEEMTRVAGIGPATIEDWQNLVEFSMKEEENLEPPLIETVDSPQSEVSKPEEGEIAQPAAILPLEEGLPEEPPLKDPLPPLPEMEETLKPAVESKPLPEPDSETAVEKVKIESEETPQLQKKPKKLITRKQGVWFLLLGMLLTFLFATGLSLGIMAFINDGQLLYASPADIYALNTEVESINVRIDTQEETIAALTERIDNLEELSDRMSAAEAEIENLYAETDRLTGEIDVVEEDVSTLQTEVSDLQSQTKMFTTFFESMRDLFTQFFPGTGQD